MCLSIGNLAYFGSVFGEPNRLSCLLDLSKMTSVLFNIFEGNLCLFVFEGL